MKILRLFRDLIKPLEFVSAGCGAAWLARRSGGPKVGGSNPLSPTRKPDYFFELVVVAFRVVITFVVVVFVNKDAVFA